MSAAASGAPHHGARSDPPGPRTPQQWGSAARIPPQPESPRLPEDTAAGLVRPYTASNGRTRPLVALDQRARLATTGSVPRGYLTPEQRQVLALCRTPTCVAEITDELRLPAAVTKVLLGDLLDCGALSVHAPAYYDDPTDRSLLEAVLKGLRGQL
jgi:hypothetical protein